MQKLTDSDRKKIEVVKSYLKSYASIAENQRSLSELPPIAYTVRMAKINRDLLQGIENAISLLEISRGRTIVEKRHIGNQSWKQIAIDIGISKDTCFKLYRDALLKLYEQMGRSGMI